MLLIKHSLNKFKSFVRHEAICYIAHKGAQMAFDYDKLYGEERDALGKPTKEYAEFFKTYSKEPREIIDIGCGQGRDAIMIARHGHKVIAIDGSPNAIGQLSAYAHQNDLKIDALCMDIRTFKPDQNFDVIILDRVLHMLEIADAIEVLTSLLPSLNEDGYVLISDEKSNMPEFKMLIHKYGEWQASIDKGGYFFTQKKGA